MRFKRTPNPLVFALKSALDEKTAFGTEEVTDDVSKSMNAAYERGWGIVPPSGWPTLQDFNALSYTQSYLLGYIYQAGMAEWDKDTTYYPGNFTNFEGHLYLNKKEAKGVSPLANPDTWERPYLTPEKLPTFGAGLKTTKRGNGEPDEISMGLPLTITSSSKNGVKGEGHSHSINKATLNSAGIVSLSSTLSVKENSAATPKLVKGAHDLAELAMDTADNAQDKANQVPNPLLDQLPIGASSTAYKLITLADLKAKLGVPAKTNVVQTTGTSTTAVMSQKAVTDIVVGIGQKWTDVTKERVKGSVYMNSTSKPICISINPTSTNHSDNATSSLYVDNVNVGDASVSDRSSQKKNIFTIVPPKSSYKYDGNIGFNVWRELS